VVLPERVAPGEPILPSSAAVFVKYRPPLDEDAIMPRIHNLVASSIPGLAGADGGNKISVVMVPTELPPPSIQWTKVGPFKVQAGSAGWLTFTLVVLIALALLAAGIALLEMLKRNKGLGAALSKMMGPVKAAAASASERAGRRAAGSRRT
jgi:type III secretion protein J